MYWSNQLSPTSLVLSMKGSEVLMDSRLPRAVMMLENSQGHMANQTIADVQLDFVDRIEYATNQKLRCLMCNDFTQPVNSEAAVEMQSQGADLT